MNSPSVNSPAMNAPAMNSPARSRTRGFTLIEVMVALVITAVGLLGIAKIQALAYASTGSAGIRSLVALQAAGLAASMHANRNYWSGLSPPVVTITGTTISDATLNATATATTYCVSGSGNTPCDPPTLAAFDLHTYATALSGLLPGSTPITTITCAAITPTSCTIQVTWAEHAVSVNSQSAASTVQTTSTSAGTFAPTYVLYVEP
jgi:type IV pilus assembly protein PilV